MCDLALLVSHVEKDLVMGITPHELCYGPLQNDCLGRVVEVCSVVRERGAGNQKQTDGQSSGGGQSIPHIAVHGNSSPVQFSASSPFSTETVYQPPLPVKRQLAFAIFEKAVVKFRRRRILRS